MHIRLNIYIWKIVYVFGLLFSINVKKTDPDQSILQALLFCPKRSVSQSFKSSSCKKVFPRCPNWYNFLRWMFFIVCDNCKQYFLHKFIITHRLGTTAMLLLKPSTATAIKQVFWKTSAFYVLCYLHNNITMMLIPKFQNKASTS